MRAVVAQSPGPETVLVLMDVPDPEPTGRECVIAVAACGVCMHDVATRDGTFRRGVQFPVICGHEISGTVVDAGPDTRSFGRGDRVVTTQRRKVCGECRWCRSGRETLCPEREFLGDVGLNGGYAEFVLVEEDNLVRLPDEADLVTSAILACALGTSLNAIRDVASVRAGETVLITGATGGLGSHAVQVTQLCGGIPIAVTTNAAKADILRSQGALVIETTRGQDFSPVVRDMTNGVGADVAIDNVGSAVFSAVRKSMALGGRWVLVGEVTGGFVPFNPAQLFLAGISLLTALSTSRAQLEDVVNLAARGLLQPLVADRLPLEEAPRAHELTQAATHFGRLILTP